MNIPSLRKDQILWLHAHHCRHGHTYLDHAACFESEHPDGAGIIMPERVGFLDCECCLPGTLITTTRGLVPIEDVTTGDFVLTHKNRWQRVIQPRQRNHWGYVHSFGPSYFPQLSVTGDHPVFTMQMPATNKGVFNRGGFSTTTFEKSDWTPAKNLSRGNLLLGVIPDEFIWNDIKNINVGPRPKADRHKTSNVPEELEVTDTFLTLIGLFLGDGYSNGSSVEWDCGLKDKEFMETVESEMTRLGARLRKTTSGNMIRLVVCNQQLASFFRGFYNCDKKKALPRKWLNIPTERFMRIVHGLLLSDGVLHKGKRTIFNTSWPMMRDIATRLNVSGVPFNGYIYQRKCGTPTAPDVKRTMTYYILNVSLLSKHIRRWRIFDFLVQKVGIIEQTVYEGPVYNLEVEGDESYIANGIVVHNCTNLNASFGYIICYCIKEANGAITSRSLKPDDILEFRFDKPLLEHFVEDAKKFDRFITYYGRNGRFDIPYIRTRALVNGVPFPTYGAQFVTDLYDYVKYKLKLHRNRLETACEFLGIPAKEHRLSPLVWQRAQAGDQKSLTHVLKHCQEDVTSTELLWNKLHEFGRLTKTSI